MSSHQQGYPRGSIVITALVIFLSIFLAEARAAADTGKVAIHATVKPGAAGKIRPKGVVRVRFGKSKLFTATPKRGYFGAILLDGALVAQGKRTKPVKYTLTRITQNHVIEGVFCETSPCQTAIPNPTPNPNRNPSPSPNPNPMPTPTPTPSPIPPPTPTPNPTPTIPEPNPGITGPRRSFGDYGYVVPPGMTEALYSDGVGLIKGGPGDAASCAIFLLPLRPAEGDLSLQALSIIQELLGQSNVTYRLLGNTNDHVTTGISGRGWNYASVSFDDIFTQVDPASVFQNFGARILLINLGGQVAPVYGIESPRFTCFGPHSQRTDTWAYIYYALEFPGHPTPLPAGFLERLYGTWTSAGGSAASLETYQPDGTYTDGVGDSSVDMYFVTNGRYEQHGDLLLKFPSNGQPVESHLFRVVYEPAYNPPGTVSPALYKLVNYSTGAAYEHRMKP